MKKFKQLPKFKDVNTEAAFWQAHDSADYIDWTQAKLASFPNLKPSRGINSVRNEAHRNISRD